MGALAGLFADNILPIMIAASMGFLIQRLLGLEPRPLAQVVFYIFTPAFIFSLLVSPDIPLNDMFRMVSLASLLILTIILISWLIAKRLRLPPYLTSVFVLTSAFMNAGNFGLPLNKLAFGQQAMAWASLFFITSSMLTNSVGVYIATAGKAATLSALKGLLRVPVIYAIPLALLVRSFHVPLPRPIMIPIDILGSAAIPLMMVLLGVHIANSGIPRRKDLFLLAVGIRLLISPLLAWMLASIFHLSGAAKQAAIIEAAAPTAVYTTVLASQFDVDPEFASGTVLASTLLSPLTITPLIYLLGA